MFDDELFGFVTTDYTADMDDFRRHVDEDINHAELSRSLEDDPDRDDLIFVSAVPWVSFTSVSHPWDTQRQDSFPRITWGKFYKKNERVFIPLSIAVHHALCDGVHIGKFFKQLTHAIENIDLSA
jgi:chloramphenicol O-acetyltransferase type A